MKASLVLNRALTRRGRRALGLAGATVLCLALVPAAGQAVAAESKGRQAANSGSGEELGNYDSRRDGANRKVLAARSAALAARPSTRVRNLFPAANPLITK